MNEKLLKRLEDEKQWDTLGLFERHAVGERPALLTEMCGRAAKKHDDAGALRLLELLLLAIDDAHAEALRKEDPPRERQTERTNFHADAAKADQARAAVGLLRSSPSHREGRWHDRETYESGKTQEPTLLKFKQRLLEIAAQRWRETSGEAEADALLGDLIVAWKRKDPTGAEDLLSNAFRATKEHHAQRVRAVRGTLRLIMEARDDGEKHPARTLWLGLARTFDLRDLERLGAILQHLPLTGLGYSQFHFIDAALVEAVARDAESYAKTHAVMRDLAAALKLARGQIHAFMPAFPRPGQVELAIVASSSYSARGQEENDFHDLAGELRDQVKAWLKARATEKKDAPFVKLTVSWPPSQYASKDSPPRYQRTFELG